MPSRRPRAPLLSEAASSQHSAQRRKSWYCACEVVIHQKHDKTHGISNKYHWSDQKMPLNFQIKWFTYRESGNKITWSSFEPCGSFGPLWMAHYLWHSLRDVHVARLSSATLDQPELGAISSISPILLQMDEPFHSVQSDGNEWITGPLGNSREITRLIWDSWSQYEPIHATPFGRQVTFDRSPDKTSQDNSGQTLLLWAIANQLPDQFYQNWKIGKIPGTQININKTYIEYWGVACARARAHWWEHSLSILPVAGWCNHMWRGLGPNYPP